MSFIAILVSLVVERAADNLHKLRRFGWFCSFADWVYAKLEGQPLRNGPVGVLLVVGPVVVAVWVVQEFFGDISARKFIAALMGTWALVLIPVALSLLLKRRTHNLKPWDKLYLRFCARLAKQGIVRDTGEAPGDFAERVKRQRPSVARAVDDITSLYSALAYDAGNDIGGDRVKELQRALSRSVRRFQMQPLR